MAFPAAETTTATPPAPARAEGWWVALYRRIAATLEGYPLERIGLAALAAGVVLRLAAPFFMDFRADGDTYTAMGHAWMRTHTFLMPYGDVTTWGPLPPGYSNHYPPAYPLYLGLVFSIFGFGLWQAKIAAVVMALAALGIVYACTRDLYGPMPAALVAGLIALEPHLVWVTGAGFSENLVLLFFALTMWAILRSLKDDRYIVLAGLFAALAYLSRASVGYFFVIAGMGGFLWRLYYRGWKVLLNKWYMGAIALFLGIALAWAARNATLFPPVSETFSAFGQTWTVTVPAWETSSYTRYVQNYAYERPQAWLAALRAKIPYFIIFLAWWVVPFLPESWRATKRVKEEHTSALWLSVFLVWLIAWIISGMFTVFEKTDFISNNHRYVIIGLLPLAWLVVREARFESASFRLRYVMLALALFAACGAVFTDPIRYSDLRAAEHMDPYLHDGDEVAIGYSGSIKYAFYPYLSHPERLQIYGCGDANGPASDPCQSGMPNATRSAHFVVSLDYDPTFNGYTQIGAFRQAFADGGVMVSTLWGRNDVVAARHIPTGLTYECSAAQLPPCPLKK